MSRDVRAVPSLAVEQSRILFDEAKQLDHFIRQIAIRDPSPGFGFVVPTPEPPLVVKLGTSSFEKLACVEDRLAAAQFEGSGAAAKFTRRRVFASA